MAPAAPLLGRAGVHVLQDRADRGQGADFHHETQWEAGALFRDLGRLIEVAHGQVKVSADHFLRLGKRAVGDPLTARTRDDAPSQFQRLAMLHLAAGREFVVPVVPLFGELLALPGIEVLVHVGAGVTEEEQEGASWGVRVHEAWSWSNRRGWSKPQSRRSTSGPASFSEVERRTRTLRRPMPLPSRSDAQRLLEQHVQDAYQRHHATMVATALAGYASQLGEDADLWFVTGLLHDLDFEAHPEAHPGPALQWFHDWDYPEELRHAVEAHAYGYNGYTTLPRTRLAAALLATDELCGIFYAYRRLNPVRYGEMKPSSIKKKLKEPTFAAKIDRSTIQLGCEHLGLPLDDHLRNMVSFLSPLD